MLGGGTADYWLAAVVSAAAAGWSLFRCIHSVQRDRLVADTPRVRIRSAAQGYVKVSGTAALPDEPLFAPLSRRPCVWWRYEIKEKRTNSRGENEWKVIDNGSSVTPFPLVDGDAACLVGPVNAEITATSHDVWYGDRPRPDGIPTHAPGLAVDQKFRFSESRLSAGDRLSVLGELRSASETGGSSEAVAALLKRWKNDQAGLLARFDHNHDGRIDALEWETVRSAALATAQAEQLAAPIARISVIGQPTHGEPFIIAALDSAALVSREKHRALIYLGLALGCAAIFAWSLEHARAMAGLTRL